MEIYKREPLANLHFAIFSPHLIGSMGELDLLRKGIDRRHVPGAFNEGSSNHQHGADEICLHEVGSRALRG